MVHRSLCYILPGVIPRIRLQHVARVKGFSDIIMDPNKLTLHKKEIILSGPVLTVGSPLKKNLGLSLRSEMLSCQPHSTTPLWITQLQGSELWQQPCELGNEPWASHDTPALANTLTVNPEHKSSYVEARVLIYKNCEIINGCLSNKVCGNL